MSDVSVLNAVQNFAEHAPEAFTGYGPSKQYGRLTMAPMIMDWKNRNEKNQPTRVPLAEWQASHGEDLTGQTMELQFEVDIQEFNANLNFNYNRAVRVENNKMGKDGQVEKYTDWADIVKPSLEAVFGANWATTCNGTYVEVIDEQGHDKPWQKKVEGVPQVDEAGKPVMVHPNTIKFLRKFASKEECLAARNETYKQSGDGAQVAEAEASEIPEADAAQARSVINQMGSLDAARPILAAAFPQHAAHLDALIAAANPIP